LIAVYIYQIHLVQFPKRFTVNIRAPREHPFGVHILLRSYFPAWRHLADSEKINTPSADVVGDNGFTFWQT